jgi:MYXO-CTERM domain-containing protein
MNTHCLTTVLAGALLAAGVARADADLALTLGAPSTDTIHYGESLTLTATVVNRGPATATRARLEAVTLPDGFEVTAVTGCVPTGTSPLPCTLTGPGAAAGQIIAELDPADPQHAAQATITVRLAAPDPLPATCPDGTPLTAAVAVTSDADPDAGNDGATSGEFEIGTFADLAMEMSAPESAGYGDTVEVRFTLKNLGPCAATDVFVDDENGVTAQTMLFQGGTGDCTTDPLDLDHPCSFPLVEVGEEHDRHWTLTYRIGDYPSGLKSSLNPVSSTAYSISDDAFDPNPDNDTASTTTYASRSVSGCSTGAAGGALGVLFLALPLLRRRRRR